MIQPSVSRVATVVLCLALCAMSSRARAALVTWEFEGRIDGLESPFTTTSYFARPFATGETVRFQFVVETSTAASITGTYASHESAITNARALGSDWSIDFLSLARGAVIIANDSPDYGDSLALPSALPELNLFPSNGFYLGARRDLPGRQLDGPPISAALSAPGPCPSPPPSRCCGLARWAPWLSAGGAHSSPALDHQAGEQAERQQRGRRGSRHRHVHPNRLCGLPAHVAGVLIATRAFAPPSGSRNCVSTSVMRTL